MVVPHLLKRVWVPLTLVCLPTLLVLAIVPASLYFYGLHAVGTPRRPSSVASPREQLCAWRTIESVGTVSLEPITPWHPIFALLSPGGATASAPGSRVAAAVAGRYVHGTSERLSNIRWHVTTYAVAVWLTRHRSPPELAAEALPIVMAGAPSRIAPECN